MERVAQPKAGMEGLAETPQRTIKQCVIPICVFLFSLAYLCVFLRYSSLEPDEGILLQGARRILAGQIPYRDFFTFYTPGSFYFLAALFKLADNSFIVARLSIVFCGATCAVFTCLITRRVCSRSFALLAATLTTIAGFAYRFLVLHNWYSTLLAMVSLYSLLRFLERRGHAWAFATGFFCALTCLFEQSKGAGLLFGLILSFLALRIIGAQLSLTSFSVWNFTLGLLPPFLFTGGYFGVHHSIAAMDADWVWPLRHYTTSNHVIYGYQNWSEHTRELIFRTGSIWLIMVKVLAVSPGFIVPGLALFPPTLLFYLMFKNSRKEKGAPNSQTYYVAICSVLSGLLLSVLIVRADIIHFMYLAPFWYITLAWVLDPNVFHKASLGQFRPILVSLVAATFGFMSLVLLLTASGGHNRIQTRRGIIRMSEDGNFLRYVLNHTQPGEKILVYPYLPLYYYLTATYSAAPMDYFQPGMNTVEQAQQIVQSLKSENVHVVLFEPSFAEKIPVSWPGTPISAIANDAVSNYIVRTYRVCRVSGDPTPSDFEFMVPLDETCPRDTVIGNR